MYNDIPFPSLNWSITYLVSPVECVYSLKPDITIFLMLMLCFRKQYVTKYTVHHAISPCVYQSCIGLQLTTELRNDCPEVSIFFVDRLLMLMIHV